MLRLVSNYINQGQESDFFTDMDDANANQADFLEYKAFRQYESSQLLPEYSRALALPAWKVKVIASSGALTADLDLVPMVTEQVLAYNEYGSSLEFPEYSRTLKLAAWKVK